MIYYKSVYNTIYYNSKDTTSNIIQYTSSIELRFVCLFLGFLTSYKILISFNGLINKNKIFIYYLPEAILLFFCVVLDNVFMSYCWIFSILFFSASASSGEILRIVVLIVESRSSSLQQQHRSLIHLVNNNTIIIIILVIE